MPRPYIFLTPARRTARRTARRPAKPPMTFEAVVAHVAAGGRVCFNDERCVAYVGSRRIPWAYVRRLTKALSVKIGADHERGCCFYTLKTPDR